MGLITIFSLTECPHCQRTKSALKDRNIPYTDINLSLYPERRTDMLKLADRLTVPQVFFNEQHIGGADDTLALLNKWDADPKIPSAFVKYQKDIAAAPSPNDKRLQAPTEPPAPPAKVPERPHEASVSVPTGDVDQPTTNMTVLEMTKILQRIFQPADRKYNLTVYKNCFTGKDAVKALMKEFDWNEEQAVNFGKYIQDSQLLHHVTSEHTFGNTSNFFRLQCHQTPSILNSYRVWTERVDPNVLGLTKRLKSLLGKVETKLTDENGNVDYALASTIPEYAVFEEAVCELQKVDLSTMNDQLKLAFGINTYNFMIKYAFMKVGVPKGASGRSTFFGKTLTNIGGHLYSLSELENGILRANRKAPYALTHPFGNDDPRKAFVVTKPDGRIHFALNCGAKSCPPVKNFTEKALNEELRIVALSFFEPEDNCRIDEKNHTVYLSTILYWYRPDFASSKEYLPHGIVEFLRGKKKETLERMLKFGKKVTVKFIDYDWSTNAGNALDFDPSILDANQKNVLKAFSS